MRALPLLFALAPLVLAPCADAQINLAWNNCLGVGTHAANKNYVCDGSASGPFRIVISFMLPAEMPQFTGMSATLGLNTGADPTLPDFWRLGVGECHEGRLSFPGPVEGLGNTTCVSPWSGTGVTGAWAWSSEVPYPRQARATFAQTRDTPFTLAAFRHYMAGVIVLDMAGVTEGSPCPGCTVPSCFEVTELRLVRAGGAETVLTGSLTRDRVFWQGGPPISGGGCLTPLPSATSRRTWGGLKSTYR